MKPKLKQDRAWLLANAKAVAAKLKEQSKGTRLRIRMPSRATLMETDGWRAVIGNLRNSQIQLQVWFDRFSGYNERKLYAGFFSDARKPLTAITKRVGRNLWPIRVVTDKDVFDEKHQALGKRIGRSEFSTPVLEQYENGRTYYGIFDLTKVTSERLHSHFCTRAVAFFDDVARALPPATIADPQREVYPKCENRPRVTSHIQRERSGFLASERKCRDNYTCQVCGFNFEKVYGSLGSEFAEAHHRVPLNKLGENIKTSLKDLTTVCANCHRMLHRMLGKYDDVRKLRNIVSTQRRKQK